MRSFPDEIIVSGLGISHLEIEGEGSTEKKTWMGMMDTIAESWAFAGTDFQVITRYSGFGKIREFSSSTCSGIKSSILMESFFDFVRTATWMRGKPGSTIQVQNFELYGGDREIELDCGIDLPSVGLSSCA